MRNALISFIIVFLLVSCESHESVTRITEFELVNRSEQTSFEKINQALINENYDVLNTLFLSGLDPDTVFPSGKTMLAKAIESEKFKLVNFLLEKKASPDFEMTIDGRSLNSYDLSFERLGEESNQVMEKILRGRIKEVSEFLFFKFLSESVSLYDMDWLEVILQGPIDFFSINEKDFNKLFFKRAPSFSNNEAMFSLLLSNDERVPKERWREWSENHFRGKRGRYRKAKCQFFNEQKCFNFEEVVKTCSKKAERLLKKNRKKIAPLINFRNITLGCDLDMSLL